MAEASAGLVVPVRDPEGRVVFRAVVVRELDEALSVGPVVTVGEGLWAVVCEEVQAEFAIREVKLVDPLETEQLVEPD